VVERGRCASPPNRAVNKGKGRITLDYRRIYIDSKDRLWKYTDNKNKVPTKEFWIPQRSNQCNNTMKVALGATSEVHAERVRRQARVLAQPRSHSLRLGMLMRSLGEEESYNKLSTTVYVLCCLVYYMCYSFREVPMPSRARFRDHISEGFQYRFQHTGIDMLHPLGTFEC
jgi:hypothetical protein